MNCEKNSTVLSDKPEKNDFKSSIANFKAADAEPSVPKRKSSGSLLRLVSLILFGSVFVGSMVYLADNLYSKRQSDKLYENLQNQFGNGAFNIENSGADRVGIVTLLSSDVAPPYTPTLSELVSEGGGSVSTPKPYTAELAKMRASLKSLANINPDIYGWIKVPGTNINYPVVQTSDNDYYLNHDYEGNSAVNGSIYADFRVSDDPQANKNTVLYGHNITSGSMFHGVEEFFNRDFFDNTKIYLYTMEGIFIYEAFSIHKADYDSGYIDTYFPDGESFAGFLERLKGESDLEPTGKELTADSTIITLSTCTNTGVNTKRYALHGVLTEAITD